MADTRELSREVMNIRQASAYLGVSTDTLYKYVYEEKIPAFKLGNRWKFKKTILDAWMEKKSLGGNAEDKGKKRPKAAAARAGEVRHDRACKFRAALASRQKENEGTLWVCLAVLNRSWVWISAPAASRQSS
jgi:excisionase family DNA binding protein